MWLKHLLCKYTYTAVFIGNLLREDQLEKYHYDKLYFLAPTTESIHRVAVWQSQETTAAAVQEYTEVKSGRSFKYFCPLLQKGEPPGSFIQISSHKNKQHGS